MSSAYPILPLSEVLTERRETPDENALKNGEIAIVDKIGFNDGVIQLRQGGETRTGMILIKPGDLVVSGINAAKGAVGMYGREHNTDLAATIHYSTYRVDDDKADLRYLWWLLRSDMFRELMSAYVPGGIKTELRANRLLPIPVPIPTIDEQRHLAARIKELAGKIEEARALRQQAGEAARALVASVVQRMVVGVPAGVLGEVLIERPRNGWSPPCDEASAGTPVLTLSAVSGYQYRGNEFKRTAEPTTADAHYWLKTGDLLITRSNTPDLVGHAAIYDGRPEPCIYPDLMMKLVVDEAQASIRFVHYWLMGPRVRDYIGTVAKGTSPSMRKISQADVMGIPFPTQIGINEQHRLVQYLDGLQAKVRAVKALQAETQAELDAMLPSVLDRAFRGEL